MSETTPETKSAVPSDLDERMRRFDERMANEEEEAGRPSFTKIGTVQEAMKVVQAQLDTAQTQLKTGHFSMEAQRHAHRETIQDLEWLLQDLEKLKNILASED